MNTQRKQCQQHFLPALRPTVLGASLLVLMVLAAGCGPTSETPPPPTPTPPPETRPVDAYISHAQNAAVNGSQVTNDWVPFAVYWGDQLETGYNGSMHVGWLLSGTTPKNKTRQNLVGDDYWGPYPDTTVMYPNTQIRAESPGIRLLTGVLSNHISRSNMFTVKGQFVDVVVKGSSDTKFSVQRIPSDTKNILDIVYINVTQGKVLLQPTGVATWKQIELHPWMGTYAVQGKGKPLPTHYRMSHADKAVGPTPDAAVSSPVAPNQGSQTKPIYRRR